MFFYFRNACGAVKTNLWSSTVYFLGYIVCWAVTLITSFIFVKSIRSHSDDQHLTILSVLPTLTNDHIQNPLRVSATSNQNHLAFAILFVYVILLLPHTISVVVNLFVTPTFEPDPWIDPRVDGQVKSVTTNSLESLFVFTRYVYNAVVPITILANDGQTRQQSRLVFCCRWNEVSNVDSSSEMISTQTGVHGEDQTSDTPYDLSTPVLFATPEGLHLRVPQSDVSENNSGRFTVSNSSLKLATTFCDLRTDFCTEIGGSSKSCRVLQVEDVANNDSPAIERNVRFSSKVDEIKFESGVWSSSGQGSNLSATHTVNIPLFVKGEQVPSIGCREDFSNV